MLSNLWPQVINSQENVIPVPGEMQLNDQWSLRTRLLNSKTSYNEPYQGQVDRACLTGDLLLSCFQPGDRFSPFGMNGKTMKLGDFWTNEGLPARARTHWPLIRSGDQIIWIPGFRIADSVRVTENTSEIIQIELIKKSSGS
jgi:tRNA(Ile)-lysidine synthase